MLKGGFRDLQDKLLTKRHITVRGCWEWTGGKTGNGYGKVGLNYRTVAVHRVAAMLWMSFDLKSPLQVLHHCDNRICFNPEHLHIGTHQDNMDDGVSRGRFVSGMRHHNTRLSDETVQAIRATYATGLTQRQVAAQFRTSQVHVGRIARGETRVTV